MQDPQQMLALTDTVRDILIILGSLALLLVSGFMAYAGWQLYRLGRELYGAVRPILASVQGTTESLEAASGFVQRQLVSPGRGLVSLAIGTFGLLKAGSALTKQLRRNVGDHEGIL